MSPNVMKAIFFTLFCILPLQLWGQQVNEITLPQAIEIGLSRSFALQKAALQATQQDLDIAQIRTTQLPALSFQHDWNGNLGPSFSTVTGSRNIKPTFSSGMSIGTQIPIYDKGQINYFWKPSLNFRNFPALQEAEAQKSSLEQQIKRNQEEITFTILSQFLDLLNAIELIKLRELDLSLQKEQLQKLQLLIQGGQRAPSEVYQQEAAIAQADFQLLKSRQGENSAHIRLVQTLRLDPFKSYRFILPVLTPTHAPQPLVLDSLIQVALENRADVLAQKLQVTASGYAVQTARTGTLPSLYLSANMGTNYASQANGVIPRQYFDNLNGGIGLSLSIPLIDNGKTKRSVQQARIRYEQSILDLESLQQNVASEIRVAHMDYLAAYEELKSAEAVENAATRTLIAEQNRFDLGVSTLYERNQAQKSLSDAKVQRLQAAFAYMFQEYILSYYLGIESPLTSATSMQD